MTEDTNKTPVLDHGYIKLIESWGSDERIIEAARQSTDKGFEGWGPKCGTSVDGVFDCQEQVLRADDSVWSRCPVHGDVKQRAGDEKLLRYLYENQHSTPFEFAGAVIEVQAPIFVFREWHRHRTQSYNEMSARYTPLPNLNYVPTVERLLLNSKTNKQAGVIKWSIELTEEAARYYLTDLQQMYDMQERMYQNALRAGVPKELARGHLPVGRYSRMRASANLRNWLGFLTLRMAPNAQWEIRQYALAVHKLLTPVFPRTMELFDKKGS